MKKYFLTLSAAGLVGCTTIGQQITNHSGTIQIEQQNVPLNAQADASNAGFYTSPIIPSLRHYEVPTVTETTLITNAPAPTPTPQKVTNSVTNTTNIITTPEQKPAINNSSKTEKTNNVTVNVYTETISIRQSSLLADAFNYFFEE